LDYKVGRLYNLQHRYVGNKIVKYQEILKKVVERKDGKVELRFTGSRKTFVPISSEKQYGIISVEEA